MVYFAHFALTFCLQIIVGLWTTVASFLETFPTPRLVHLFPSGIICNRYEIVCLRLCKNYSVYKYNIFVSADYFSWLYTVKRVHRKVQHPWRDDSEPVYQGMQYLPYVCPSVRFLISTMVSKNILSKQFLPKNKYLFRGTVLVCTVYRIEYGFYIWPGPN